MDPGLETASIPAAATPGRRGALFTRVRGYSAVALALLLIALAAAYPVGRQVWGGYQWRQAEQALSAGDLVKARAHAEACLSVWPNSMETHLLLAQICRRSDDLRCADAHLREANRLGGPDENLDLEQLMLDVQEGEFEPAASILAQRIGEQHPAHLLMLEALVKGFLKEHYLPEAYHWASVWIERAPENGLAWYLRGLSLRRQLLESADGLEMVRKDLEQAVQLRPEHAPSRLLLAVLLESNGRPLEALAHFETFRQRQPEDAAGVVGHARCLQGLGQTKEAQKVLDDWFRTHPHRGTAEAYLLRAQLDLEEDAEPVQAIEWLRKSLELAPKHDDTLHTMALTLRRLGRHVEAEEYEERCRSVRRLLNRLKETSKRITVKGEDADLRHEAGAIQMELGNEERALLWFRSALQDDPNHRPTHQALAEWYRKRRNFTQASVHQKAASKTPQRSP